MKTIFVWVIIILAALGLWLGYQHVQNIRAQSYWNTALLIGAANGDLDQVSQALIHHADLNAQDEYGDVALTLAARAGAVPILQILIAHGAHVNGQPTDSFGLQDTALIGAAEYGHLDAVNYLLSQGATVNNHGAMGITALIMAARYNHLAIAKRLLQSGADIHAVDDRGFTALIMASGHQRMDYRAILRLLRQAGGQ